MSSIPSKFETTLMVGHREKNGFGNRTHRFNEDETDVPGPGNYNSSVGPPLVLDTSSSLHGGSVSSKGMGPLASVTDRFGPEERRKELEADKPGPGTHAPPVTGGPFNRTLTVPVPVPIIKKSKYRRGQEPLAVNIPGAYTPGPGVYEHEMSTRELRGKQKRASPFMAGAPSDRFNPSPLNESRRAAQPAPGTYDALAAEAFLKSMGRHCLAKGFPSNTFRSKTTRADYFLAAARRGTPGPGSYEADRAQLASAGPDSALLAMNNSSMFSNTNQDRFGNQYRPKSVSRVATPGPGWYAPDSVDSAAASPAQGSPSSSGGGGGGPTRSTNGRGLHPGGLPAFRDTGSRFEEPIRKLLSRGPGPAFYQPTDHAVKSQKSFILNASGKWV